MAYPKARGDNPLNYDEYDPTPFSGGYDQVALYGRPKDPSPETCYPISEVSHHGGGAGYGSGGYGGGKPSDPKYGVDEGRPSYQHEDPPHGSQDLGYGQPKPSYEGGEGYGRPKPKPSSYGSYEQGGSDFGSGYGESKEEGFGRHRPKPEYGGSGFGRPESGFGQEQPAPEDGGFGGGFGGIKPARHESEEGGFGGHRPEHFSSEGGGFGGGRLSQFGGEPEEGGFGGGRPHRFGGEGRFGDNEGGFGGGRKPGGFQTDEFGGGQEEFGGFGGRKQSSEPSYFGEEPAAPSSDEGFGGYQGGEEHYGHHDKHHHKHHWRHDDE